MFISREKQLNETETNLADCKTKCKQMSQEIAEHLDMISRLNGTIEKQKVSHSEEVTKMKRTIDEKLSEINGLEHQVEKCEESIRAKSLEIAKLNGFNKDSNESIKNLESTINQLNQDIVKLTEDHSNQITEKENSIQTLTFHARYPDFFSLNFLSNCT